MEILGLAVVVVLLLVATTFVVRFLLFKPPADVRKGFVVSQLAKNMVDTFLNTAAVGCSQLTMTELLQDCAESKTVSCDDGRKSCDFVDFTAKFIFNETLNKWNMRYQFLAYVDAKNPLIKIGEECKGQKLSSNPWAIPIRTGNMYAILDLCG